MSQFGAQREASDGVRQVYTGIENFATVKVNPTHEELKQLYTDTYKEDTYIGTGKVNDVEYPQLKIVIHCNNQPEAGQDEIVVRPTFWITKAPMVSTEKGTTQYINMFGRTAWLSKEDADKNLPVYNIVGANGTYVFDGSKMRKAYRGEPEFIDFLRNLLNLPSPQKVKDPMDAASMYSIADWDAMFGGNYKALQHIAGSTNKIGLLLGAKVTEKAVYQDVFTRSTLRQYAKAGGKFEYTLKQLDNATSGGAYPETNWGPRDLTLRIYDPKAVPTQANVFGDTPQSEGAAGNAFFKADDADAFAPASTPTVQ